ncbi:MAG: RIP metalloprotease RseP, partial [Methylophilales bacterium 16-45-7]
GVKVNREEMQSLILDIHYTPLESLQKAIEKTWDTSIFSLKMLGNMITGKVSWKGISGPVSIASFAGESANLGLKVFIGFLALVSISIGVLNLLPIPVLDGGHLMYYMAEIIKGSPVSEQVMVVGQKIGLGVLGLLMMVAIFNDINRFMIG